MFRWGLEEVVGEALQPIRDRVVIATKFGFDIAGGIGSSPFDRDRSNRFYNLPGMAERITKPDHPANVSWNDAQEFIAALNAREGH